MNTKQYLYTARSYAIMAYHFYSIGNTNTGNYYKNLCKLQISLYKRYEVIHGTNILYLPKVA